MLDTSFNIYGTIILLSLLIGFVFIYFNSKELKFSKEEFFFLVIYLLVGMLLGAKYYDYFVNMDKYSSFNFFAIGLSSSGAVIGALIMIFIYVKQFNKEFISMLNLIVPSLPLIYGLSKIACFISGCCYGIEYSGLFNVVYYHSPSAPYGVSLFPIQIIETIVFVGIFIYFYLKRKTLLNNKYVGYLFVVCGFSKFILDFFRHIHTYQIISTNQVICLLFIIIGIFFIKYKGKKIKIT